MLTTYTSTCSSPVMTVPPSLPPESAVPLVEFEMLPAFGLLVGVGVPGGASVEGLPDPPRSRAEASLASACALKASTYTARMASATATTFVVTESVLVIFFILIFYTWLIILLMVYPRENLLFPLRKLSRGRHLGQSLGTDPQKEPS